MKAHFRISTTFCLTPSIEVLHKNTKSFIISLEIAFEAFWDLTFHVKKYEKKKCFAELLWPFYWSEIVLFVWFYEVRGLMPAPQLTLSLVFQYLLEIFDYFEGIKCNALFTVINLTFFLRLYLRQYGLVLGFILEKNCHASGWARYPEFFLLQLSSNFLQKSVFWILASKFHNGNNLGNKFYSAFTKVCLTVVLFSVVLCKVRCWRVSGQSEHGAGVASMPLTFYYYYGFILSTIAVLFILNIFGNFWSSISWTQKRFSYTFL